MLSNGNQRGFLVSLIMNSSLHTYIQAYIVRDDKTKFSRSTLASLKSAQISAEHQVAQNEGDDTLSPSTSCFLESEERSVGLSLSSLSAILTIGRHLLSALI